MPRVVIPTNIGFQLTSPSTVVKMFYSRGHLGTVPHVEVDDIIEVGVGTAAAAGDDNDGAYGDVLSHKGGVFGVAVMLEGVLDGLDVMEGFEAARGLPLGFPRSKISGHIG
ncbi:hypothetical protein MVEN_00129200 [Mycena venus]|uniref:Uncharacterized protein n=1 Tax=Mycena venus TaxID=2733690 RepID=A0A8H6Z993_9AGAR|nr:hypothetical protein MVEN_00129200 [Mycena venus]